MHASLESYSEVCALFGALSAPVRAAIVHRLVDGERSVGELVSDLGISQPLVSQHLRMLRAQRLVHAERRGQTVHYSLADAHVAHVFLDALTHTTEIAADQSRR